MSTFAATPRYATPDEVVAALARAGLPCEVLRRRAGALVRSTPSSFLPLPTPRHKTDSCTGRERQSARELLCGARSSEKQSCDAEEPDVVVAGRGILVQEQARNS